MGHLISLLYDLCIILHGHFCLLAKVSQVVSVAHIIFQLGKYMKVIMVAVCSATCLYNTAEVLIFSTYSENDVRDDIKLLNTEV